MSTEPKPRETTADSVLPQGASGTAATSRKPYEAPRVERRIPVASNTLQPTSGTESVFPEE